MLVPAHRGELLLRSFFSLFYFLYFSCLKQTEALLARISILRQEHFELKENVKDVEEALQSERGKGNFRKNNYAV